MNRGLRSRCAPRTTPSRRLPTARPHRRHPDQTPPTTVMRSRLITEAQPDAQRARTVRRHSTRANRSLRKRPPTCRGRAHGRPNQGAHHVSAQRPFQQVRSRVRIVGNTMRTRLPDRPGLCAVGVGDGVCAPSRMPAQLDGITWGEPTALRRTASCKPAWARGPASAALPASATTAAFRHTGLFAGMTAVGRR